MTVKRVAGLIAILLVGSLTTPALAAPPVAGLRAAFAADVERAFASVPEPGVFASAGVAGLLFGTRARRRATVQA